jgi:transcriptional regulator with GAF, ATPase, and Fis domain
MSVRDQTTLQRPSFDLTVAEATFELVVIEGADAGQSVTLDGSQPARVLVGQGPACGFRLRDPSVSRRHLAVDVAEKLLRVTDLGSKNGTTVEGVRIVDAYLRGGERVRIGGTTLQVHRREVAPHEVPPVTSFGRMIGVATEMRRLYPLCGRLAQSLVPVVVEGETGTGKEVLARSLHEQSPRAKGPFVVFDCTAVAASLLESELFGHERGAFTGAAQGRAGVFEQSHGGTLFIDEIGDLELPLQPKLLRAIESGEIRRVGSSDSQHVDVRVIAATRRDLDREVAEGRFRDDLFHRLAVARVELPPLRSRRGDVEVLARHFCAAFGASPDAIPAPMLRRWETSPWPGNVRELRNAVLRQLSLGDLSGTEAFAGEGLPEAAIDPSWLDQPFPKARRAAIDAFERWYVKAVLARHEGNVTRAAGASGLGKRYFQMVKARSK